MFETCDSGQGGCWGDPFVEGSDADVRGAVVMSQRRRRGSLQHEHRWSITPLCPGMTIDYGPAEPPS